MDLRFEILMFHVKHFWEINFQSLGDFSGREIQLESL